MLLVRDYLIPRYKNSKEVMKTLEFQYNIGGTMALINIPTRRTKGCVQQLSKKNYFSDTWFSRVKTSEEVISKGVDYCDPVKTTHVLFFLSALVKLIKE